MSESECTCGHIVCVCWILREHLEGCLYRLATTGVPIECEHDYDVCPRCDPCTCGGVALRKIRQQPLGAPFTHTIGRATRFFSFWWLRMPGRDMRPIITSHAGSEWL